MTGSPCHSGAVDFRDQIPGPAERAALNAAHRATGAETGFWDDDGKLAPWPDDIDDWMPSTTEPQPVNPRRTTLLTEPQVAGPS